MSIGVSHQYCPRHHVAIEPYTVCKECMQSVDTQRFLIKRWGVKKVSSLPIAVPASRTHLPALCRDLGFTKGAEIGVWRGAFAASFCHVNPQLHMLCVDPWVSYPAWVDTKNAMPPEEAEAFMGEACANACARLKPLNATIVRKFSADAAHDVPDGSLDFAYIDGNHVYEAVTEDITLWAPKVRSGGFLAGHDFRVFDNKPFIHVVKAVADYTQAHAIDPWFVLAGDRTPSWLWVKQ